MIAADTSTWVAYLEGAEGEDVALLDQALRDQLVVLPPVVFTELLSTPDLPAQLLDLFAEVPLLEIQVGFWERAAVLRRSVLARRRRARLADALIAQTCLDHGLLLITRDRDFQAFAEAAGLRLAVPAE